METKTCTKCNETKPVAEFSKRRTRKDGLQPRCKVCRKAHYEVNKDKVIARSKAYYEANKDKEMASRKAYHEANREKLLARMRAWQKANPDKINAYVAKRRGCRLQATPPWLTADHLAQIQEWYTIAQDLQWLSEEPLEVDHIVPLQGKNVCGLHVPWNLQILPKSQNRKKGNRLLKQYIRKAA
jgi:5-methylcytosine-specific restriction endonuclease McrA